VRLNTVNSINADFQRDVYCLLGLPIDNIGMDETEDFIYKVAETEGEAVLSTVNVNWAVQSFKDVEFRKAILKSEIVVMDGKPLLWLAKLFGLPMKEVVPGSTLIDQILSNNNAKRPLSIFLFGGENGSADQALEMVNNRRGGLSAVGALNPGFGSVAQMSSDATVAKINRTHPDILLVALGAKKGTQWIEKNRQRLNAKIVSHLGATINFLAGRLKRAPNSMRNLGIEWVWRIFQEPKLFSRYLYDGCFLLKWLAVHCNLLIQFNRLKERYRSQPPDTEVDVREMGKDISIRFGRNLTFKDYATFGDLFAECAASQKNIILDFGQTEFLGPRFLGLLLMLMKYQHKVGRQLSFVNMGTNVNRIFQLFSISDSMLALGFKPN